jgi:hypothetical protein
VSFSIEDLVLCGNPNVLQARHNSTHLHNELFRMAADIATSAFVEKLAVGGTSDIVEWYRNRTVCSPASVRVLLNGGSPMRIDEPRTI